MSGGVRGIGVWLRGMRVSIQLALWLKMSLYLSMTPGHGYTIKCSVKGSGLSTFLSDCFKKCNYNSGTSTVDQNISDGT